MQNQFLLFGIIAFGIMVGCKPQKINRTIEPINSSTLQKDTTPTTQNSTLIWQTNETKIKFLDAKCKFIYQNSKENSKAKVKLRMRKDSLIWISITGPVGIEGIRAKMTKDSVWVVDYINKRYKITNFDTLSQMLNFQVNYQMLQAIILGDMPLPNYQSNQSVQEEGFIKILQKEKEIDIANFLNPSNRKLSKLHLKDNKTQSTLQLVYENFMEYSGYFFPNMSKITVHYFNQKNNQQENTFVDIEYSDVKITDEEISFPFSIPTKYKRE